ncbi:cytochrome oxidase assembly protein [Trypanosoma rangeli]|uniref:Cytochrome oxidase assembly protein n=1 Tax=Trypanosoma rangeli TaxID=5698 RepID=A0A422MSP3_TRYRA|nr:cytochrome oxidase assembly protein [Trypanosoma rangeli]RNE96220.1 cytochrome oxidase assembly protein [Trypanosoma rangeli]|eukprot:RNE96220.1 cytochrome oxidase assembly protein [Trypanosoma rangeli]
MLRFRSCAFQTSGTGMPWLLRFKHRLQSTVAATAEAAWTAPPTNRAVAHWLYCSAALVGGVVVIGGVTRLTESGLSIVDWKPVTGVRPPLTRQEWEEEFAKYQNFPEFKQKDSMTMEEFKFIFFWEWAHRLMARSLGLVYGVPMMYFLCKGRFKGHNALAAALVGILALGGAQGAMGWYMVRSGLDPRLLEERRKATVSAYRLAAHLVLAFVIYSCMMRVGFGLKLPHLGEFQGKTVIQCWSRLSFAVVFCTVVSGAFVAGLDAGLMYNNEFPWMGGGLVPPRDHLFTVEPWWRNALENPAAAQTWHRLMAAASTASILGLNVACLRHGAVLPKMLRRGLMPVNGILALQVGLGIWTIVSYVDVPIATTHQLGSLLLLTSIIRLCALLGSRGLLLA